MVTVCGNFDLLQQKKCFLEKLSAFTLARFDLTTLMLPSGDETTRPRRQGTKMLLIF
jgi:hypothetical protein